MFVVLRCVVCACVGLCVSRSCFVCDLLAICCVMLYGVFLCSLSLCVVVCVIVCFAYMC